MIYDIFFLLIVIAFGTVGYFRKASKSLVAVLVFVASVLISYYLSRFLSPLIYDSYICPWIVDMVSERLSDAATAGTEELSQAALSVIPAAVLFLLNLFGFDGESLKYSTESFINESSLKIAEVCGEVMRSPFVSVITFLLGVIMFIVLMILLGWFSKYIQKLFTFLLTDTLDKALGSVFGALQGVLVVIVLGFIVSIILPYVSSDFWLLTPEYYESSLVLTAFFNLNLNFWG